MERREGGEGGQEERGREKERGAREGSKEGARMMLGGNYDVTVGGHLCLEICALVGRST